MIKVCRERGDPAGVEFWSYALNVNEILGDQGQSDEEDTTIDVDIEGVVVKQSVKKVLRVYWRHPWLESLFRIMNQAPALEKLIFHRAGAKRIPRIYSDTISHRAPITGYPREFFREAFLSALLPHDIAALNLAEYSFPLADFSGYNPSTTSGDGEPMQTD
ncbi:hypothetical protein F5051DRAFT_339972 [Lentinula edodes]|nr:hypothetical protein F5051DRAFT_339972 [Lentinula edodes]KAJ4496240.1 hypothetical protein C8J55DRAFT_413698 [Lentinula edodes]